MMIIDGEEIDGDRDQRKEEKEVLDRAMSTNEFAVLKMIKM